MGLAVVPEGVAVAVVEAVVVAAAVVVVVHGGRGFVLQRLAIVAEGSVQAPPCLGKALTCPLSASASVIGRVEMVRVDLVQDVLKERRIAAFVAS